MFVWFGAARIRGNHGFLMPAAMRESVAVELPVRLREAGVSVREAEVLEALASRLSNAEVAERLFISVRTVESHVSALLRKLGVPSRRALSQLAREMFGPNRTAVPFPGALADACEGGPFVGRGTELADLVNLFEQVRRRGRRRLALVTGEAGIGKTRLAAEAAARCHRAGGVVIHGRSDAEGFVAFQAFADAVRPLAMQSVDPFAQLVANSDVAPAHRYELFEQFDRLLASRSEPLVFVLDDVQWADRAGLEMLRHVLRRPDRSPLLVIATARPESLDPTHPLAGAIARAASDRMVEFVALRGLSPSDVEALAAHVGATSPQRAHRIWERTGGNPFLISTLLRLAATEDALSESARDAIVRQVAGLGPPVVRVLSAAAVVGEVFDGPVLSAALGADVDLQLVALERAIGAGLVVEDRTGAGRYRFSHAIVREALIETTSTTRRARFHLRIAAALEAAGGSTAVPERARHLHAALPLGDAAIARRAALAAAAHAMDHFAYEVAASFSDLALDAIDAGGGDESLQAEALLARGDAFLKAGDLERAIADFKESMRHARRGGDRQRWAEAVLGWAAASVVWGRHPGLRAAIEELLASGVDDPALRAQLRARLAQALYYEGERAQRGLLSRTAVEDARASGRPETLASVLVMTHAAIWGPEELDERTAVAHQIVDIGSSTGRLELEASGLGWLAADLLEAGDVWGAGEAMSRHGVLAERLQQRLLLRDVELWSGMRAILNGRFEEATASIERARRYGEAAHDPSTETMYWVQRFWLACERENPSEMDELVDRCERLILTHPDVPAWRAALAMLHARRGDRGESLAHFEVVAARDFRSIPRDVVWLNAMTYLAETCALLADAARARALAESLAPYGNRLVLIDRGLACKGSVLRFLGLLAATIGDLDSADRHLRLALAKHEAMDAGPLADRTRRDLAEVARRRRSASAP